MPRLAARLLGLALGLLLAAAGAGAYRPEGVDPYEVLGLKRGGELDAATLKKAYRKAALRWHPDKVSEEEKKEAEKKFIEISWAYEVLSDPAQKGNYDVPPQPGQPPPGGGGGGARARDFSMEEAAKVFREAFGTTSDEYRDLINHLMASSGAGDKKQWSKHAEAIAKALKKKGKNGDFSVETSSKDGSERMKTSQTSTVDSKGTVTKKTVTQHTHTTVNGGPAARGALHGGAAGNPALAAHMAAHEAAVRAAQEAQRAALAGAGMGHGMLGRGSEL